MAACSSRAARHGRGRAIPVRWPPSSSTRSASAVRGAPDTVAARAGRAALGRAPARRGHARHRQDAARQVARGRDRRPLRPGAVHARPAARRRHRHLGVRPGDRRVGLPAGPDLRQRRARRRGEPRVAAHAGRAARADGRAPGHRRRRDAPAAGSVLPRRDRRTRSAARARSRCPRASSTGSRSCARSGCPGRVAEREILDGEGGVDALDALAPVTVPAELAATIAAVRDVHCAHTVLDYVLDVADATRNHPGIVLGASPRASLGLAARRAGARDGDGPRLRVARRREAGRAGRARAPHRARARGRRARRAGWRSARSSARSSRRVRDSP